MKLRNERNWRQICEEVLREHDPDKVNALLAELLDALEERAATSSKRPSSSETQAGTEN
jgi:hypothetical protein